MRYGVMRSTVIGWFSGILPGVGATLAAFLSYNEAVRWSKTPEKFGTGIPEGVVAPETANNAATGAAMIPLLALGLPGGALTAMMIGVFNVHDMEVGPLIMMEAHDLVWILFASMFWASLAILFSALSNPNVSSTCCGFPSRCWRRASFCSRRSAPIRCAAIFSTSTRCSLPGSPGSSCAAATIRCPPSSWVSSSGKIGENSMAQALTMLDYNFLGFFTEPVSGVLVTVGLLTVATEHLPPGAALFRLEPLAKQTDAIASNRRKTATPEGDGHAA